MVELHNPGIGPPAGFEEAAIRIQSAFRTKKAKRRLQSLIKETYTLEYDEHHGSYFYYNCKNGQSVWDKPLHLGFHVLWRDQEEQSQGVCLYSEAELQSLSLCDKGVRKKASSEGYRSDSLHGGWSSDTSWAVAWSGGTAISGLPACMLDKLPDTQWSPVDSLPNSEHHVVLDFGTPKVILGLKLFSKPSRKHTVKHFRLEISDSPDGPWKLGESFEYGRIDLPQTEPEHFMNFSLNSRCVKLIVEKTNSIYYPQVQTLSFFFQAPEVHAYAAPLECSEKVLTISGRHFHPETRRNRCELFPDNGPRLTGTVVVATATMLKVNVEGLSDENVGRISAVVWTDEVSSGKPRLVAEVYEAIRGDYYVFVEKKRRQGLGKLVRFMDLHAEDPLALYWACGSLATCTFEAKNQDIPDVVSRAVTHITRILMDPKYGYGLKAKGCAALTCVAQEPIYRLYIQRMRWLKNLVDFMQGVAVASNMSLHKEQEPDTDDPLDFAMSSCKLLALMAYDEFFRLKATQTIFGAIQHMVQIFIDFPEVEVCAIQALHHVLYDNDAAIALAESAGTQGILERVRNLHDDDYELIRLCDLTLSLISDSKA